MSGATAPNPYANLPQSVQQSLKDQGFPPKIINAFLATATTCNSLVWSRTPGPASYGFINRRYDLKGFYNKTKSCDWGPMAGFVCALPWFNKSGTSGAPDNVKYLANFVSDSVALSGQSINNAKPPFIPLCIPQSRIPELGALLGTRLLADLTDLDQKTRIIGFACDSAGTVVIDFLLRQLTGADKKPVMAPIYVDAPDPDEIDPDAPAPNPLDPREPRPAPGPEPLWEIRCANLWVKQANNAFLRIDPQADWTANPPVDAKGLADSYKATLRTMQPIIAAGLLSADLQALAPAELTGQWTLQAQAMQTALPGFQPTGAVNEFAQVKGCLNPYPPYTTPDAAFLNAVSGDFDLYAAWPSARTGQWSLDNQTPLQSVQRASEKQAFPNGVATLVPGALLDPEPFKLYARSLAANPNVIIEFIIANPAETPEYGNINDLVLTIAGDINAQVYLYYNRAGNAANPNFRPAAVNACFHSDEGGRPFTKDMDLPVALFVSDGFQRAQLPGQPAGLRALLVGDCATFLNVVMAFKDLCLVPLQAAWFAVLMEEAETTWNGRAMKPVMQKLILGDPPSGGYSAAQIAAYNALLTAFRALFGTYNPGARDGTGGKWSNAIPAMATDAALEAMFAPFDAISVQPR